jgi:hypothetical protein
MRPSRLEKSRVPLTLYLRATLKSSGSLLGSHKHPTPQYHLAPTVALFDCSFGVLSVIAFTEELYHTILMLSSILKNKLKFR